MLSHTFYETHTAEFFDFYRQKLIVHGAKPNAAHLRLAALEREGKCRAVVTQNIDGLHQAAGSKTVYELHGSTLRNYCTRCGKFFPVQFIEDAAGVGDGVPRCDECAAASSSPMLCLYEEGWARRRWKTPCTPSAGRHPHRRRNKPGCLPGGGPVALLPRGEPCCHQQAAHPADAMANLLIHAPIGRTLDPDAPIEV